MLKLWKYFLDLIEEYPIDLNEDIKTALEKGENNKNYIFIRNTTIFMLGMSIIGLLKEIITFPELNFRHYLGLIMSGVFALSFIFLEKKNKTIIATFEIIAICLIVPIIAWTGQALSDITSYLLAVMILFSALIINIKISFIIYIYSMVIYFLLGNLHPLYSSMTKIGIAKAIDHTIFSTFFVMLAILFKQRISRSFVSLYHETNTRKKIQVSEKKYAALFSQVSDSIPGMIYQYKILKDGSHSIPFSNARIKQYYGVSPKDVVHDAMSLYQKINPSDKKEMLISLAKSAKERTTWHSIHRVSLNTTTKWLESKAQPTIGEDGSVTWFGYVQDITERHKIERIMVQSEKMSTVAGLAAGMAHEINNPLGIILQTVNNAQRRLLGDLPSNKKIADEVGVDFEKVKQYAQRRDIDQYITTIADAGERAANIVANMLEFSRQKESIRDYFAIHFIIEETIKLAYSDYDLKNSYDFKQIKIEKNFADLPFVPAVKTALEQVFLNLLKNSAQAMATKTYKSNTPKIVISTLLHDDKLRIIFEDNGPGIDPKVQEHIFEPFYTTKDHGVGTGLGLSVTYFIINTTHSGNIFVESEKNLFTRFIIDLPLS